MGDNDIDAAAAAFLSALAPGTTNKKNKKKGKPKTTENNASTQDNSNKSIEETQTATELTNNIVADSTTPTDTISKTATASGPTAIPTGTRTNDDTEDEAARILAELGVADTAEDKDAKNKKKKRPTKKPAEKKPQTSAMGKLAAQHLAQQRQEEEALKKLEEEKRRKEEEEERRIQEEIRKEEERKEKQREKRRKKKEEDKKAGKAVTKAQKLREQRAKLMREQLIASGKIEVDEDGKPIVTSAINHAKAGLPESKVAEPSSATESSENHVEAKIDEEKKIIEDEASVESKATENVAEEKDEPVIENWEDVNETSWEHIDSLQSSKFETTREFSDEEEDVKETFTVVKPAASKPKVQEKQREEVVANQTEKVYAEDLNLKAPQQKVDKAATGKDRELRSPICCVMGHVDTGKTKILDKLRKTNVQDNEAGGITQQIGATYFPMDKLRKSTDMLNKDLNLEYKVPGLLMIDTPGHESFSNLRKRGSNLCDIAILIVDLMHGLEPQTIESLNLLRAKRTPFIVCINKVDRLYNWKAPKDTEGSTPNLSIRESLARQGNDVIMEFDTRVRQVITQLMEQGLNSKLYYENDDFRKVVSLVPTSAHTGEGLPDLLMLLIQLTQKMLFEKLVYKNQLECNVIEVKKIEGIGTSIDVILVNGKLKEGDEIVVSSLHGAVQTQIKALLTPQPLREMRVKSNYIHHKEIRAAMGVKIVAPNLEDAIAGTEILVYKGKKDKYSVEELKAKVMEDYETIIKNIDSTGYGVCVQASTLGSLEALIDFLKSQEIPINSVNLGPIHKKDVMRASVMLEHKKEFATILAFDVKVTKDAQEISEELGVKIFTAEIIYHLFDQFTKYMEDIKEDQKNSANEVAVFPCILKIIQENVFMKKSPLIFGVEVVEGIIKVGTPLVVPDKLVPNPDNDKETIMLYLGRIASIERDHKEVNTAKTGSKVCIKVVGSQSENYVQYGRHFDHSNLLYSKLSRESIDALKTNFKDDLEKNDWLTVIKLKKVFNIT